MGRRRGQILFGALVVVLAVAGYRSCTQTSPAPASASNGRGRTPRRGDSAMQTAAAPDVNLAQLKGEHPKPQGAGRNLFRVKPKAPPPAPPRPPQPPPVTGPPVASGPPPVAPITLKFIGFYGPPGAERVAVLSDGMGTPVSGKEGATILGRYKILRIGEESIEMAYLDGRGRTTIRLTGS